MNNIDLVPLTANLLPTDYTSLLSTLTINKKKPFWLNSQINISPLSPLPDLFDYAPLLSMIKLNSSARYWISNIHDRTSFDVDDWISPRSWLKVKAGLEILIHPVRKFYYETTNITIKEKINYYDTPHFPITLSWEGRLAEQNNYPIGTHQVTLRGSTSSEQTEVNPSSVSKSFTVKKRPILSIKQTPNKNNYSPSTTIRIEEQWSNADYPSSSYTYSWTGRISLSSRYPLGRHVITLEATDPDGEVYKAGAFFFVISSQGGGMLLTGPHSNIHEPGISGAFIVAWSFLVPSVSGHSGNDYATVTGLSNGSWRQIRRVTTRNGVNISGTLPRNTYTQLKFYYYASHCMYYKSNITYTVDYEFIF